jgi:hypothetical protein
MLSYIGLALVASALAVTAAAALSPSDLAHAAATVAPVLAMAAAPAASNLDIATPAGGQIALTAYNNGDGTWSVKRGPNGAVLQDGLPREQALAIVGGATGPYEPSTPQEAGIAEQRAELEKKAADIEVEGMFRSDAEVGAEPAKVGRIADAELQAENERLQAENAELRAQVARFDADGDGKTGGGRAKPSKAPAENGATGNGGGEGEKA